MLHITNGLVIDPYSGLCEKKDILSEEGRILVIGTAEEAEECLTAYPADMEVEVIDAEGLWVVPGLVDIHSHFRDPGYTYKEDLTTGAAAAAAGGYTSVVCMANTNPCVDNVEVLKDLIRREARLPIHVYQTANLTVGMKGRELTNMEVLAEEGAVGFTDDGVPVMDEGVLRKGLETAARLDVPVSLHEESAALLGSPGVNEGWVAARLGVKGAAAVSEYSLIARDGMINAKIGAYLDIQHVSSGISVDVIRFLQDSGVNICAEVTPHHFSLTEEAVMEKGTLARVNPPIRTEEDRRSLIEGMKDGVIEIIATDHAPHSDEEKNRPFDKAPSGMVGLETAVALAITHLYKPGHLDKMRIIEMMTINPAELYKLDAGRLYVEGPADITLIDPDEEWTVREESFFGKSKNSPFIGEKLVGRVKYTICRGKIVYEDMSGIS